jgi:hypothetical protein
LVFKPFDNSKDVDHTHHLNISRVKYLSLIERIFENDKERHVPMALSGIESPGSWYIEYNNKTVHITRPMNFLNSVKVKAKLV